MKKLEKLKKILQRMDSALLAYSGGVDSSLLLKVAFDVLGMKLLAVTAVSDTYPREELLFAQKTASQIGVRHKLVQTKELLNKKFIVNYPDRCYVCKKELFGQLNKLAREKGLKVVIEASTLTDAGDFRPGTKAKKEMGVRSPLVEAGFTKEDVRRLSKNLGLTCWNKPSCACLASRVPYGVEITRSLLNRVEKAEAFLRGCGFKQVRVRSYEGLCRIEVEKESLAKFISLAPTLVDRMKSLGYRYVTVDLEGYRLGSMNLGINKKRYAR